MSKFTALLLITLFICSSLASAARPGPSFSGIFPAKTRNGGFGAEEFEVMEEKCEGIGEEECLMRRTLAAHVDYIYTQKQKP